jgi:hypothetical protein
VGVAEGQIEMLELRTTTRDPISYLSLARPLYRLTGPKGKTADRLRADIKKIFLRPEVAEENALASQGTG